MRWRIGITFLIIICVLFAAMICAIDIKSVLQGEDEFKLPVGEDEIIWFIDDEKSYDAESSMQMWNGLMVSEKLYDILQKVDKSSYVAIVVQNNQESVMEEFVFKGKTYREYVKELEGLEAYLNKLEILLKEGEMLRYGELLYTEGVEDGIRWSKEYYDERVLFYGKELLQKFIVESKSFLLQKIKKCNIILIL